MPHAIEITPDLLERHSASLRALARSLLRDAHAAEDVLQDAWLQALQRSPVQVARVGGWLHSVVRSLALKRLRGERRRTAREAERGTPTPPAPDAAEQAAVLQCVTEAVLALDEPYRATVLQRFFEGLPPREIARRQEVSVSTVKSRLQRALARLRTGLERERQDWRQALALLAGLPRPEPGATTGSAPPVAGGAGVLAAKLCGAAALLAVGIYYVSGLSPDAESAAARPRSAPLAPETRSTAALVPGEDQAGVGRAPAALPGREPDVATGALELPPAARVGAPAYAYTITGVVLDANDVQVSGAEVFLGPLGHPLNVVGSTDESGRFEVSWHGRRPSMELAVGLRTEGRELLRRIRIQHGTEHRLRWGLADAPFSVRVRSSTNLSGSLELTVSGSVYATTGLQRPGGVLTGRPLARAPRAGRDPAGFLRFSDLLPPGCSRGVVHADASLATSIVKRVALSRELTLAASLDSYVWLVDEEARDRLTIRGTAFDPEGRPASGAWVSVEKENGAVCWQTCAEPDGTFELAGLPPGEHRLRAGGGDRGLAHAVLSGGPGETLTWEPALDRGLEALGRLLDPDGAALEGWRVEARVAGARETWVDGTRTDAEGRFAIPNLPTPVVTLAFVPPQGDPPHPRDERLPARVLPGVLAGEEVLIELTADELARGALTTRPEDHAGGPPAGVEGRLWHAASGQGVWLVPQTRTEHEIAQDRPGLGARDLPAGHYELELGAGGLGWVSRNGLWLAPGASSDLGTTAFPAPGRVVFELPDGQPDQVCVLFEHPDVRTVRSGAEDVPPPALLLPAGEHLLLAREREAAALPFVVSSGAGTALRIEATGTEPSLSEEPFEPERHAAVLAAGRGAQPVACDACHRGGGAEEPH